MYKLRGVSKTYKKRGVTTHALRQVDLDLPSTGLLALLGESGSGKSTLLGVLSLLSVPKQGTVEIDGTDSSKFSDSQRHNFVARGVGSVFQEDEMISHATLLENMQASLKLAGFSKSEVVERAEIALRSAGLSEFERCLPEQLSKRQLRSFSFARATAKDPKILLLDEPEIGLTEDERENLIQKIKGLSTSSLVVVATRDNSFAQALQGNIVKIEDGVVNSVVEGVEDAPSEIHTLTSKAQERPLSCLSMLSLVPVSLRNRCGRSFVLGLSAALGIVALAIVLSLSNGIIKYIDTNNRDNLSQQPLQIGTISYSSKELTDLFSGDESAQLSTSELITKAIRSAKNNDLQSLRTHIENNGDFYSCTELIDYDYGITPQVFATDTSAGTISLKTSIISELSSSYTASFTSPAGFTTMARLDAKTQNYTSQYDILQGRWPEEYSELVLVLPSDRSIPGLDLTSNSIEAKLQRLNDSLTFFKTGRLSEDESVESYNLSIQEYMDLSLKLVSVAECYTQSEDGATWQNNSSNEDFMKNIVANSEDLKIVGVVAPSHDATSETLSAGLWYLPSLEDYIAKRAGESKIVQAQKANPDVDVFTGIRFDSKGQTFDDLANSVISSIDSAFASIESQLNTVLTQLLDDIDSELSDFARDAGIELNFTNQDEGGESGSDETNTNFDWKDIFGVQPKDNKIVIDVDEGAIDEALLGVFSEYIDEATSQGTAPTRDGLVNYLAREDVDKKLNNEIDRAFVTLEFDAETNLRINAFIEEQVVPYLISRIEEEYGAYIVYLEAQIKAGVYEPLSELEESLAKLNGGDAFAALGIDSALNDFFKGFDLSAASEELSSLLGIDDSSDEEASDSAAEGEAGESASQMDSATKKFLDMIVKMATTTSNTYSLNMKALGYSDFSTPSTIRFYTPTYNDRAQLNSLISAYNDSVNERGEASKHIDYYDLVDTLTNVSIGVVNAVSFLSVLLLLFSGIGTTIIIGAITFFSSRDRWRETSVMRVLGATRLTVFLSLISEGALLGLLSSAVGIGVSALLSIPINASTSRSAGLSAMVFEPWHVALLLALGIVSMVIGYLIPAIAISRKDAISTLRVR